MPSTQAESGELAKIRPGDTQGTGISTAEASGHTLPTTFGYSNQPINVCQTFLELRTGLTSDVEMLRYPTSPVVCRLWTNLDIRPLRSF